MLYVECCSRCDQGETRTRRAGGGGVISGSILHRGVFYAWSMVIFVIARTMRCMCGLVGHHLLLLSKGTLCNNVWHCMGKVNIGPSGI